MEINTFELFIIIAGSLVINFITMVAAIKNLMPDIIFNSLSSYDEAIANLMDGES